MSHTAKIGVVTVTYNSADVLPDFLSSFAEQVEVDATLYAVDNASSDATLRVLRGASSQAHISLIANVHNAGVAVGNNQGIVSALADGCEWVLLLNNDTVFGPDFIAQLLRVAQENKALILSPVIEATDPPGSCWYVSGTIQRWQGMKVRHTGIGETMPLSLPHIYRVEYASTCALLVHADVFRQVGLMDPVFFVYGDDVDFCLRATRAGFKYWATGDVQLMHKASSLTGEFTGPFATRWISRNWVVVARKHCGPWELAFGSVYMVVWALGRFLVRREPLSVFRRRLRAFLEGWAMRLDVPAPQLAMTHE